MNPNTKCFAAARLNGIVTQFGETTISRAIMLAGRLIIETPMEPRDFSTIELRLSKRPVEFDFGPMSEDQKFIEGFTGVIHIPTVSEDDLIDSEEPAITYREIHELSQDPIWTSYKSLIYRPRDNYTGDEYDSIVSAWMSKYANTKFRRLI